MESVSLDDVSCVNREPAARFAVDRVLTQLGQSRHPCLSPSTSELLLLLPTFFEIV